SETVRISPLIRRRRAACSELAGDLVIHDSDRLRAYRPSWPVKTASLLTGSTKRISKSKTSASLNRIRTQKPMVNRGQQLAEGSVSLTSGSPVRRVLIHA